MHHFVTEMCTNGHMFFLQNDALCDTRLVHCGIYATGLFYLCKNTSPQSRKKYRTAIIVFCVQCEHFAGKWLWPFARATIDPSHKSHNTLEKHHTMHHFVTEMCTNGHMFFLQNDALCDTRLVHCGIYATGLFYLCKNTSPQSRKKYRTAIIVFCVQCEHFAGKCLCHDRSKRQIIIITCQNLHFGKYVGLTVCLSVCLFIRSRKTGKKYRTAIIVFCVQCEHFAGKCLCHDRSERQIIIITCQNLHFGKYVGLMVCLSVCLFIRSRITREPFEISSPKLVHRCILVAAPSLFLFKVKGQGHRKGQN